MLTAPVHVIAEHRPPASSAVIRRPRLEERLDQCRSESGATWISGPAGAGKSTLVSSYLAVRGLPLVWHRLDEREADPRRLFAGLALSAAPLAAGLPVFAGEQAGTLARFAERFFSAMFAAPGPAVLVLDHYQDAAGPAADALLRLIMSAMPPRVHVLILSRCGPPPVFAAPLAARRLARIDNHELRLTLEETRALAAGHGVARGLSALQLSSLAQGLHAGCAGWVAGIVLMLPESAYPDAGEGGREQVHAFFAEEVFACCSPALRTFLLHTSVLAQFSAELAQQISGDAPVPALLRSSNADQWFIQAVPGTPGAYRYLPIFRQFLLAQLQHAYAERDVRRLRERALALLLQTGELGGAAALLLDLGDAAATLCFCRAHAAALAATGGMAALESLLGSLPSRQLRQHAELLYWLGVCRAGPSPHAALALFEEAFWMLAAGEDAAASLLAWAGLVDTIVALGRDLASLDYWLEVFAGLLRRFPAAAGSLLPASVLASAVTALSLCAGRGANPGAAPARWLSEALAHMSLSGGPARMTVAGPLLTYFCARGDAPMARMILADTPANASALPASARARLLLMNALSALTAGEHGSATLAAAQAESALEGAGQPGLRHRLANLQLAAALSGGDLAAAQRAGDAFLTAGPAGMLDQALHRYQLAGLARQRGQLPGSVRLLELSIMQMRGIGYRPGLSCALADYGLAELDMGHADHAHALATEALALAECCGSALIRVKALLAHALIAERCGGDARPFLRQAFGLGRTCELAWVPGWDSACMAQLAALALQQGIERGYVTALIKLHQLQAPLLRTRHWPWTLRILALGTLELERDGIRLPQEGKGQRRTLDLLKVIVALGGRRVPVERVTAALWPDAEGDGAKGAFDVAIHRLRKLLGGGAVLQVSGGSVSLNEQACWLDVWEFEDLAQAALDCAATGSASAQALMQAGLRLRACYRGAFLQSEAEHAWQLQARRRLARKYERALLACASRLREAGCPAHAQRLQQPDWDDQAGENA